MQRPILILIIVLISLGLLNSLVYVALPHDSGIAELMSRENLIGKILYFFLIIKSLLIWYHFGSQKMWFVFGAMAVMLLTDFIGDYYYDAFITAMDANEANLDSYLDKMKMISYLHFFCDLVYSAACIFEGRKNYVWLMYFGIGNASIVVIAQFFIYIGVYGDLYELFTIVWLVPNIILMVYFIRRLNPELDKKLEVITNERDVNLQSHITTMYEKGNRTEEEVTAFLIADGFEREKAMAYAKHMKAEVRSKKMTSAARDLILGGIWCVGGIIVTAVSYSSASDGGGTYVVAYGAIIIGAIQFIRGLSRLF